MIEQLPLELGLILLLGFAAQWLAWRLSIPSILLLLTFGFLSGPVLNLIHPDALFGPLIPKLVSIAVGIILFEGSLTLKLIELRQVGRVVWALNSIGAIVTWVLATLAAKVILGLSWPIALQLGAILIVTGPTVIGPLLRHVGNVGAAGTVLKWEGILIDPVGATVALLVYESLVAGSRGSLALDFGNAALGFLATAATGLVIGLLGAAIIIIALRYRWVPDYLQNPFTLTMVVMAFALSNTIQHESGLLTTTVMGIALTNARAVDSQHILEFKENLVILFISMLFIVLSARLPLSVLGVLDLRTLLFLLALLFIVRPAGVFLSALRSKVSVRERLFIAWLAPRGIVAAAVASLFGRGLVEAGFEEASRLEPLVFIVIVGTVLVYGLTAVPVSRGLGIVQKRSGFVIAGAQAWARRLATALQNAGQEVLLVDSNASQIRRAQAEGLPAVQGNILSEFAEDRADLSNLGRLLAITPNDEVNALAALHFSPLFDKENVFQLAPESPATQGDALSLMVQGRVLFSRELTSREIARRVASGATFETTAFTPSYTFEQFKSEYGERAVPLFLIRSDGTLSVVTPEKPAAPSAGQRLISLVSSA